MSDIYYRPFQSTYHLPFSEYPYQGHFQYPPPYSQQSFPPPFLPKLPSPPIAHPLIFSTHSSSLIRHLSPHNSLRIQRRITNPHNRATSLKKRRRSSLTTQRPAFLSEALSVIRGRDRSHDGRSGYKPPSMFKKHFDRFIASFSLTSSMLRLNFLLAATQADFPNIFYDLRKPQIEDAIFLPYLNRLPNTLDFCQLTTSPPIHDMTLWHRNLPWKINIEASQPNGITIYDFFRHIHHQLQQPITQEDFYSDELSSSDREMLIMAFQIRCAMFPDQLPGGVLRIDFLGPEVCFTGLKCCRGGQWEFKTQLVPSKERMIID